MIEEKVVEGKVKEILLSILDVKEEEILPSASFVDDLHASSIDLVEIFTAIENAFDVEINQDRAFKVKTVNDAVDFLKAELANKGAVS